MGKIKARVGTVGYSYRDWAGVFYPQRSTLRRQLALYCRSFSVCELLQYTHHMPTLDHIEQFTSHLKEDIRIFVRIHNAFTHFTDAQLAPSLVRHFRRAFEPLFQYGKFAGFVAAFPYAFRDTQKSRDYVQQLDSYLRFEGVPLQLDFRHPSWVTESSWEWMRSQGLGFVCVDEPALPGLVPPHVVATSSRVLVRFHGRNAEGWWSGNSNNRHDYSYSEDELRQLLERYSALESHPVHFIFQNCWQAQAVRNAIQWKALLDQSQNEGINAFATEPMAESKVESVEGSLRTSIEITDYSRDDESSRPPTCLPLSEVKLRVSRVLDSPQLSLELPQREV